MILDSVRSTKLVASIMFVASGDDSFVFQTPFARMARKGSQKFRAGAVIRLGSITAHNVCREKACDTAPQGMLDAFDFSALEEMDPSLSEGQVSLWTLGRSLYSNYNCLQASVLILESS